MPARFLIAVSALTILSCSANSFSVSTTDAGHSGDSGTVRVDSGSSATPDASNRASLACPNDSTDPLAPARITCVTAINSYRATLGLNPLNRWCSITACADNQPKEDEAVDTAHSAFGQCGEHAQDECPGWPNTPANNISGCLAQMWAEGPGTDYSTHGHYINMSNSTYTTVECGFYSNSSGWWGVQDFK